LKIQKQEKKVDEMRCFLIITILILKFGITVFRIFFKLKERMMRVYEFYNITKVK